MKICCFIDSLVSGGAQRQLVNISILLKKRGHDVSFLIYRKDLFYLHYLEENNIKVTYISGDNYFLRIFNVRKFLKDYDGDFVISFLEVPNFIACFSAIGKRNWKLITNELSAKESSFVTIRNKIYKWFERFSDWTVCNSENALNLWKEYYPRYERKLSVIYNPIIIDNLKYIQHDNQSIKTIVIPASYQYLKNPIRVVEAVNNLDSKEKSILRIHWFGRKEVTRGNTSAYDQTQELICKYGLENVVFLHEETTRIFQEIEQSSAVGLFSTVEGLPNAICEGMMLAKPILMSKVSDYEKLVTKDNGFLCDPLSISSITSSLKEFLATPNEELLNMGNESKKIAMKLFDKDVIADAWELLLLSLK